MNIFESLESLNVSEECFNDILNIVEEIINEVSKDMLAQAAKNSIPNREKALDDTYYKASRFKEKIPKSALSNDNKVILSKLTPKQKTIAHKIAKMGDKAEDRLRHAQDVAGGLI